MESDKRLYGLNYFRLEICRMRLSVSQLAATIIFCALTVLLGCNVAAVKNTDTTNQATPPANQTPVAQTSPAGDGAARITVADLRAALDKGTAVVVDVRTDDQYKAGHIKGAIHIPETNVAARANELPRDKTIVTYCS